MSWFGEPRSRITRCHPTYNEAKYEYRPQSDFDFDLSKDSSNQIGLSQKNTCHQLTAQDRQAFGGAAVFGWGRAETPSPRHDLSGTASQDCRPLDRPPNQPPLAGTRSAGSPRQVVSGGDVIVVGLAFGFHNQEGNHSQTLHAGRWTASSGKPKNEP